MKKLFGLLIMIAFVFTLAACSDDEASYEDGRYRGIYVDGDEIQVVVQFDLEDNIVQSASFRRLAYGGVDYQDSDDEAIQGMEQQHIDALEHLIGKDIREHLDDLYEPGELDIDDVDGFTGATIRSNKIISAMRDALNRGVYSR